MLYSRQRIMHAIRRLRESSSIVKLSLSFWKCIIVFLLLALLICQYTISMLNSNAGYQQYAVTQPDKLGISFLNYIVFPLDKEVVSTKGSSVFVHEHSVLGEIASAIKFPISYNYIKSYVPNRPPRTDLYTTRQTRPISASVNISHYGDYFRYLQSPTRHCRKLARMGGSLQCDGNGDIRGMDGQKMICMDPELQIPTSRKTDDCTVLSFGVSTDTTFDEDIMNVNCEIHMFDMSNFSKSYLKDEPFAHFHQVGILAEEKIIFDSKVNKTFKFDTMENLISSLHLEKRLFNVLKIDIETHEWEVLEYMLKGEYLNAFGQIALEVHAINMQKMNESARTELARGFLQTLHKLEVFGFQKVSYWDNQQPRFVLKDMYGDSYDSSGEILFVNSNWYTQELRQSGISSGFNFLVL